MLFTTAETDTDWDELSESEEIDRKAALAKFVPNFAGVIGDRVSIRRRELKLSQKNLATIYGVSRELISQIETGRANINACDLPRLALILVVPISYFFGGIEYTSDSYDKDVLASISPGARDAIKFALDESGRSGQALRPDEDELLSYYRGLGLGVKSVVLNMAKNLFELGQIRSKVDSDDDNEAEM